MHLPLGLERHRSVAKLFIHRMTADEPGRVPSLHQRTHFPLGVFGHNVQADDNAYANTGTSDSMMYSRTSSTFVTRPALD